ncbi:hypothetical protein [Spirosoma fluminis]
MKTKVNTLKNSMLLVTNGYGLILINWLEQVGGYVLSLGVDWTKLPWAFAGATIATLKAKKDANGVVIHKPFWEWVTIALSGTVIGMAGWKDVVNMLKLTPELSTVIAGLIGWILADVVINQAKKQLGDSVPKPPKLE